MEQIYEADIRVPLKQYAYIELKNVKGTQKQLLDLYTDLSIDYANRRQKAEEDPTSVKPF